MLLAGLLLYSCNNKEEELDADSKNFQQSKNSVTFDGLTDDVSVMIFRLEQGEYIYQESITSGWDQDNKVEKELDKGQYKFLYVKCPAVNTITPALSGTILFDDVRFTANNDAARSADYVLEVDEMWLAESAAVANTPYDIQGDENIKNRMTRAVSQVELRVKRGMWKNGVLVDSILYTGGKNIMEHIQQIEMTVSGVGESLTYAGGTGNKKIATVFDQADADISSVTGFVSFEGPFVFPTASVDNATVDIKITPVAGSPFPEMTKQLSGKLIRNKKLIVTVWVSSTYQFIDVDYETSFFEDPEKGDEGIWD